MRATNYMVCDYMVCDYMVYDYMATTEVLKCVANQI